MCEQWNAPVLGKGRMDRAEALVEPGNVELRGHGGGWAVQRDGGDLLLRHDVSGMDSQQPDCGGARVSDASLAGCQKYRRANRLIISNPSRQD